MGTVRSLAILAAGAAIGGVALLAYRISQDTGKPMQEALADVPGEVQRLLADLKVKAGDALEKGRALYEEKQQELTDQLKGFSSVQS
jgi:hypothetical protein